MDGTLIGLVAFASVIGLLALRVPIAFALAGVATLGTFAIFALRTGEFMAECAWTPTASLVFPNPSDLIHSCDLSMIPLFIALGNIACVSSDNLGRVSDFRIGGSGSRLVDILRFRFRGASAA